MTTLKVLDLFSGIGGFSLGLERSNHDGKIKGFETVAFCEIEEYPRKVIAKHWPEVPCYRDVRELTSNQLVRDGIGSIDIITGGFPCQDISVAGKQAGIGEGTRSGLWSECLRLVSELRPKYALFENVANLLRGPSDRPGGWFSRVLSDLASIGYDAEWENIPASAVGAPHRRERVWIIAYPASQRQSEPGRFINSVRPSPDAYREADRLVSFFQGSAVPFVCRGHDGLSGSMDELKGLGNAVVPQIPELIGNAILKSIDDRT